MINLAAIPSLYLWLALGWMLSIAGAFGYGLHLGNERLRSYEASVAAVGKAQEDWAKRVAQLRRHVNQEVVDALKKRNVNLARDNAALLDSVSRHASRSHVPPARHPANGNPTGSAAGTPVPDGFYCARRADLDEGLSAVLSRHGLRLGVAAQRGDGGLAALAACIDLVDRQEALTRTP